MRVSDLPSGTVTFLFSDLEGSTRAWGEDEPAMRVALRRHDELLASAIAAHDGTVVKSTGDGVMAAFGDAAKAVSAAVAAQRAMTAEAWPTPEPLRIRVGLHTGTAEERAGDYFGMTPTRAARIMAAAHGGQILVSSATAGLLGGAMELADLGIHRLRDLPDSERIHQVRATGLQLEFPPPRTLDAVARNFPIQLTSFVGRSDEIAGLAKLLRDHRLVTLTGVGGCGKTRLALEVVGRNLDAFPDGAFFIDLTPLSEESQLVPSVANAIGMPMNSLPGQFNDLQGIAAFLGNQQALLVIDNCEHLIDASATFADALLSACPSLRILATSRETLEVDGEQGYRVPSLGVGDGAQGDAAALFIERATAVRPNFSPTAEDRVAIGEICRRLDGIPLAIELAASRVAHMSPLEVASRLDDRFRLLTGRQRGRVQRQQTLQATMDWSWDLLDEAERMLLRRLAVFSGGFTFDAAESVCGLETATADLLAALVDKSLVAVDLVGGASRHRLLETVRLYAEDRLFTAGDADETRDRHYQWFLSWLEALHDDPSAPRYIGGVVHFDLDNARAALEGASLRGDAVALARLVELNVAAFVAQVHLGEAAEWVGKALERRDELPPGRIAALLARAALVDMARAEFDAMAAFAAEAVALEAHADPVTLLIAHSLVGLRVIFEDPATARAQYTRALAFEVGHAAAGTRGWTAVMLGGLDVLDGDLEAGVKRYEEAVAFDIRDLSGVGFGAGELAIAYYLAGRYDDTRALVERIADATAAVGHITGDGTDAAPSLAAALVLAGEGRVNEAREGMMDCARQVLRLSWPLVPHLCLSGWVAIALAEGDAECAAELLAVQRSVGLQVGWRSPIALALYRHQRSLVARICTDAAMLAARSRAEGLTVEAAHERELARAAGIQVGGA